MLLRKIEPDFPSLVITLYVYSRLETRIRRIASGFIPCARNPLCIVAKHEDEALADLCGLLEILAVSA